MEKKLKHYFPMIRESESVLADIKQSTALTEIFYGWKEEQQEAWLTFLSADEPDTIVRLIEDWPEFKPMYEQLYDMCLNTERLVEMFSKELQELDRNTVQFMIDEMQDEIDSKAQELSRKVKELNQKHEELSRKVKELNQKDEELSQKDIELNQKNKELNQKSDMIENGIRALIEICREAGMSQKEAIEKMASAYAMSAEQAEQYLKKYWKR